MEEHIRKDQKQQGVHIYRAESIRNEEESKKKVRNEEESKKKVREGAGSSCCDYY